jgi:hypothetical protein
VGFDYYDRHSKPQQSTAVPGNPVLALQQNAEDVGLFATFLEDKHIAAALGSPLTPHPIPTVITGQFCDRGRMVWVKNRMEIYVLYNNEMWEVYTDFGPEKKELAKQPLRVPPGRYEPANWGFKVLWIEHPMEGKLGWPIEKDAHMESEHGYIWKFENGVLLAPLANQPPPLSGDCYAYALLKKSEKFEKHSCACK